MKNVLAFALALAATSNIFATTPSGEPDEDDQFREAQTFHMMFATESDAAQARARLDGKKGTALLSEFQRVARMVSKDPGSAPQGGDLGIVKQGEMVKSFETALFSLPINTLSQPVKSEFGWHLILATSFRETPVRDLCEQSLGDTIRRAPAAEKERLQRTVMLHPTAEASFAPAIRGLLGPGWSSMMRDEFGNLGFVRTTRNQDAAGRARVVLHTELLKAVLTTSPMACKRSEQVTFAVDCRKQTVATVSVVQFEARGGQGRRLVDRQFSEDKQQPVPTGAGGLAAQLEASACSSMGADA